MTHKGQGKASRDSKTRDPALAKFQIVCAWCGRVESKPAGVEGAALPVSHTICESCFVKERASIEQVVKGRRKRSSA